MVDTKEILACPACGKEMTKIYIEGHAINIDICLDGCGGILFDNRELEKFDEANENAQEILETVANKTFASTDESAQRVCPVCGTPMMKMGAGSGNVQLDCCAVCGAKFLDNNELQKIRTGKKDFVDENIINFIDCATEKHIDDITYGLKPEQGSPRRQFVEDLVRRFL